MTTRGPFLHLVQLFFPELLQFAVSAFWLLFSVIPFDCVFWLIINRLQKWVRCVLKSNKGAGLVLAKRVCGCGNTVGPLLVNLAA